MSKNTIFIAVAGCGGRLTQVVSHLLEALDGEVVIRAFDPNPDSMETFRKECASRRRGPVRVVDCSSWAEALDCAEVGWALIGSWNSMHRSHVVEAFRAGKDVFAEKPLATTLEDCMAMREAWKASERQFFFGVVLRYAPLYRQIFEKSREEGIGDIISFEFNETLRFNHGGFILGNWRRDRNTAGSMVLEKCCHDIDLAYWMVGSLPVRVASFGGLNLFCPKYSDLPEKIGRNADGHLAWHTWPDPHRRDLFDGQQTIYDNQVVIMEYASGTRATFHVNASAAIHERRFYLIGSEGTLRADASTGLIETKRIGFDLKTEETWVNIKDGHDGGHAGGDGFLAKRLAMCMVEGAAPYAGMEEALISAITCFAIDRAADEGRVVDLLPMWQQAGIDLFGENKSGSAREVCVAI